MEVEVVNEVDGAEVEREGTGERVIPDLGQVPKFVGEVLKLPGREGLPELPFITD